MIILAILAAPFLFFFVCAFLLALGMARVSAQADKNAQDIEILRELDKSFQ